MSLPYIPKIIFIHAQGDIIHFKVIKTSGGRRLGQLGVLLLRGRCPDIIAIHRRAFR